MVGKKVGGGKKVGHYAFLAGILIAVIAGIFTDMLDPRIVPLLLLILGIIVGLLNISAKEFTDFLVAGIALLLIAVPSGVLDNIPAVGNYLSSILLNISTFVSFAVLIVAVKAIWELAEES